MFQRSLFIAAVTLLVIALPWLGSHWRAPAPSEAANFSWFWFLLIAAAELAVLGPFLWRLRRARAGPRRRPVRPLPWWGWLSLVWLGVWWALAWGLLDSPGLRQHSFGPLWLGYIGVVNAWGLRRQGYCLLTVHPRLMLALFPASAGFWWVFEYLNGFVGNWRYSGTVAESGWAYILSASLPFATVLPAVISSRDLLVSWPALHGGLRRAWSVRPRRPRLWAWGALLAASAALVLLPVWPGLLFPMVWVAPGLVVLALQALVGARHLLAPIASGDWRGVWLAALAALLCGIFWEMWNWLALARWEYQIPLVGRFRVFEMPLLGYGGYLPFGITCVAVAALIMGPRRALLWGPLEDSASDDGG